MVSIWSIGGMVKPAEARLRRARGELASVAYLIRVVMAAVLLARFGSAVAAETVTVLVIELLFAITVTTIWIGWLDPLPSEARLQLTTPEAPTFGRTQLPRPIVADTNAL